MIGPFSILYDEIAVNYFAQGIPGHAFLFAAGIEAKLQLAITSARVNFGMHCPATSTHFPFTSTFSDFWLSGPTLASEEAGHASSVVINEYA